ASPARGPMSSTVSMVRGAPAWCATAARTRMFVSSVLREHFRAADRTQSFPLSCAGMDLDTEFRAARERFDAGRIEGAELASVYVAERVRRSAPRRWIQGPRRPALDVGSRASEIVRVFATRDIYRLPRTVSEALVAWAAGRRDVEVAFSLPSPREVLALQA